MSRYTEMESEESARPRYNAPNDGIVDDDEGYTVEIHPHGFKSRAEAKPFCTKFMLFQLLGVATGAFVALIPSASSDSVADNPYVVALILLLIAMVAGAVVVRAEGYSFFGVCTKDGRRNQEYCALMTQTAVDITIVMAGYLVGRGAEQYIPMGGAAIVGGVALGLFFLVLGFRQCCSGRQRS